MHIFKVFLVYCVLYNTIIYSLQRVGNSLGRIREYGCLCWLLNSLLGRFLHAIETLVGCLCALVKFLHQILVDSKVKSFT